MTVVFEVVDGVVDFEVADVIVVVGFVPVEVVDEIVVETIGWGFGTLPLLTDTAIMTITRTKAKTPIKEYKLFLLVPPDNLSHVVYDVFLWPSPSMMVVVSLSSLKVR